jgi:hypothetical protein
MSDAVSAAKRHLSRPMRFVPLTASSDWHIGATLLRHC